MARDQRGLQAELLVLSVPTCSRPGGPNRSQVCIAFRRAQRSRDLLQNDDKISDYPKNAVERRPVPSMTVPSVQAYIGV